MTLLLGGVEKRIFGVVHPVVLDIPVPNIGEDQIEALPSERRAPGTVPFGKSGPGYWIMLKKKKVR